MALPAIRSRTLRKVGTYVLTLGSVTALGFLSFAGMFVITPMVAVCGTAFALAVGFEAQVMSEGIYEAMLRIFSKYYLQRAIMRQFLETFEAQEGDDEETKAKKNARIRENVFLKDYFRLKNYLKKLEDKHDHLTKDEKHERAAARKHLAWMEIFIYKQMQAVKEGQEQRTVMERIARELFEKDDAIKLLNTIKNKSRWLKVGGAFAIAGGISSGFTALSSIQVGLVTLAISSAVPGGVIVFFAILATVAYSFLLYQAFADMVQEYQSVKAYFEKKPKESDLAHALRCVGIVIVTVAAVIAIVATAGTAWFAAKKGAEFFMSSGAADVVRSVFVSLGALPTFLFSLTNSIKSVENISRSNYKKKFAEVKNNIGDVWNDEYSWSEFTLETYAEKYTWKKSTLEKCAAVLAVLRFINLFRAFDTLLEKVGTGLYFLGHLASIAVTMDRFDKFGKEVSATAGFVAEGAADGAYLPGEKGHSHQSWLLTLVMSPLYLAIGVLRVLSVGWDAMFTRSFKTSWQKMFSPEEYKKQCAHQHKLKAKSREEEAEPKQDELPELTSMSQLSLEWRQQVMVEVCDDIERRIPANASSYAARRKVQSAKDIRERVLAMPDPEAEKDSSLQVAESLPLDTDGQVRPSQWRQDRDPLTKLAAPLAVNRNRFWQHHETRSEYDMHIAMASYNKLRPHASAIEHLSFSPELDIVKRLDCGIL